MAGTLSPTLIPNPARPQGEFGAVLVDPLRFWNTTSANADRPNRTIVLSDDAINGFCVPQHPTLDCRQSENQQRQKVLKRPSKATLGNLNWALLHIWDEATAAKVVERRNRPTIDKELGEDGEPRAFIDTTGVRVVAAVMTDAWVASSDDHDPDLKRSFRCYLAMIATSGIRPGLEAKRVRIGDLSFRPSAITIYVARKQGKHRDGRSVVVYEGGSREAKTEPELPIRWLLRQQIAWRRANGAIDQDYLFPWPQTGEPPIYRDVLATVLRKANAVTDLNGDRRAAYSFRHFFATRLIELGHSVPVVAASLGTSSDVVERHYNSYLVEREADRVSGVLPFVDPMPDPWRTPDDERLDEMADG